MSLEPDRSGLHRYGVAPPTVLRTPTTDSEGVVVCPEDGKPVGASFGQQIVRHPDVWPEDVDEQPVKVSTFGYCCDRHSYPLVLPIPASDSRVPSDGWARVRVDLADGRTREIAVPAAEVER